MQKVLRLFRTAQMRCYTNGQKTTSQNSDLEEYLLSQINELTNRYIFINHVYVVYAVLHTTICE